MIWKDIRGEYYMNQLVLLENFIKKSLASKSYHYKNDMEWI